MFLLPLSFLQSFSVAQARSLFLLLSLVTPFLHVHVSLSLLYMPKDKKENDAESYKAEHLPCKGRYLFLGIQ